MSSIETETSCKKKIIKSLDPLLPDIKLMRKKTNKELGYIEDEAIKNKLIASLNTSIDEMKKHKKYNYIVSSNRNTIRRGFKSYFFDEKNGYYKNGENVDDDICTDMIYETPIGVFKLNRGIQNVSTSFKHVNPIMESIFGDKYEIDIYRSVGKKEIYKVDTSSLKFRNEKEIDELTEILDNEFKDIMKDIKFRTYVDDEGNELQIEKLTIERLFKIHRCIDGHRQYIYHYNKAREIYTELCTKHGYDYHEYGGVRCGRFTQDVIISKSCLIKEFIKQETNRTGIDYISIVNIRILELTKNEKLRYQVMYSVNDIEYNEDDIEYENDSNSI